MAQLSTHILNTTLGRPAANVSIRSINKTAVIGNYRDTQHR